MTIKETIQAVENYNAFGIENNYQPTPKLSEAECNLRHRLMSEEMRNTLKHRRMRLVEIADAW